MDGINEPDELLTIGRETHWRPPPSWVRLALVVLVAGALAAALAYALSSRDHPSRRAAAPGSTSAAPPSQSQSSACIPQQAESVMRAFIREFNAGDHAVSRYLAAPEQFDFWWDPTLPLGMVLHGTGHPRLVTHLRSLHERGIRLALTHFYGQPIESGGIGFTFDLHRVPTSGTPTGRTDGKGILDCTTGRITRLVIDRW